MWVITPQPFELSLSGGPRKRTKRPRRQFDIRCRDAVSAGYGPPVRHGTDDFTQNAHRLRIGQVVKRRSFQYRCQNRPVVAVIDVQDVFGLVDIRVHVEGRCKTPTTLFQQKTVVAQMIITVSN